MSSSSLSAYSKDSVLPSQQTEDYWMALSSKNSLLSGLQVLIVDDDPDTRELFTLVVEGEGGKAFAVDSVSKALVALEQLNPDIVVSDIRLPVENGYTLLQKIKVLEAKSAKQTPVMAVTAICTENDRLQALLAGFQAFLPKPTDLDELVAMILSLVKRENRHNNDRLSDRPSIKYPHCELRHEHKYS